MQPTTRNSSDASPTKATDEADLDTIAEDRSESQLNIPPAGQHRLWTAILTALRCPACGSTRHKARTGRRLNAEGCLEQYRHCDACGVRFRAVFE